MFLWILLLTACDSPPARWPWPASACPPGMVHIEGGSYKTGMEPPLPFAVVDTTKMAVVEAPEKECPAALAANPGSSVCWIQTDLHDPVVTAHQVDVQGYCIDRYPFPGEGVPYPPDGLSTWDASLLDEVLASGRYGPRRMCTFTEFEVAVAGPRSNLRYVYGNDPAPERCALKESEPIGSHSECSNPETGVFEYGAVVAHWVKVDEQMVAWACQDPVTCRASGGSTYLDRKPDGSYQTLYVCAGGTRRMQTRQAPYTPHTFHDHGQVSSQDGCDDWGWDDQAVICADPDPRYSACAVDPGGAGCAETWRHESAWARLLERCRGERMTACLSYGVAQVRDLWRFDACPGSPVELGSGQGR